MMLRNRSRAVSKPTSMADHASHQPSSPKPNHNNNNNHARTNVLPSLFCTPTKFRGFTTKCLLSESLLPSPTSILDTTRTLSSFSSCEITNITPRMEKIDSIRGIALALYENCENVLFGTQLRVKNSTFSSDFVTKDSSQKARSRSGLLSLSEMELSEEYTCVISRGDNPKTTHIFDSCIVESYFSQSISNYQNSDSSVDFLSFCYTCKKHLEQAKDIFIYRGDKAFCSQECRHQEMVLDGAENSEF